MKLKEDFITHKTGEGEVLLATGKAAEHFHGIVRLNTTASEIVSLLKSETTKDEIVTEFMKNYPGIQKEVLSSDIEGVLDTLRKIGALEE